MRIKLNQLSLSRILAALNRRILDVPNNLLWKSNLRISRNNKNKLNKLRNIHKNERCFLIANGPSLKQMDLSFLKNEITIGMNRIYLLTNVIGLKLNYFITMNELVIDQFHDEINKIDSIKFVNWNRRHIFDSEKAYFLRNIYNLNVKFSPDLTKGIYGGGTVTFAALQLCYFLGFKTVIIIGLDHNYKETGIPNKSEIRQNDKDESHFDPNYFPKGIKWQIPDLVTSEFAYKVARDYFEKNGKRIIDATIGGKCNVFEKKDFKSLF